MKNILTLLLLIQCLFVVCSHAQTKSETPSSLTPYKVAPRFKDSLAMALPFKSIELWDRRFDTSKLGYLKKDFAFRKITTDGNTETVLQAHLNDTYKNNLQQSSAYDLLLVVKHLWFQETTEAQENNQKIAMKNTSNATYFSKATTSLEVYARQEDQYIPLLKLDSIFQWRGMLVADIREYLALPFENCFEKLTSIDLNKRLQHGKKITVTELNNYNNKLRKYPRFQTNLMERGIYLTFQDFLNNKLHKKDFNVEFGDLTDELYVNENGTQTVFEKFWGFCDGQKTYFKIGYNFSLLTPELSTYELWGAKSITQRFGQYKPTGGGRPAQIGLEGALGSAIFNTKKATIINLPLQLNMETGEVY